MDTFEQVIKGLDPKGEQLCRRLWARELLDRRALRDEVQAYASYVTDDVLVRRPFIDSERAEALGVACVALLDRLGDASQEQWRLAQLACLYFVATEDDLDGAMGFDDDAQVFGVVAKLLGHPDLQLPD